MLVKEVMNRLRHQYSTRERGHDLLLLDINTLNPVVELMKAPEKS